MTGTKLVIQTQVISLTMLTLVSLKKTNLRKGAKFLQQKGLIGKEVQWVIWLKVLSSRKIWEVVIPHQKRHLIFREEPFLLMLRMKTICCLQEQAQVFLIWDRKIHLVDKYIRDNQKLITLFSRRGIGKKRENSSHFNLLTLKLAF
jgi:hypothetical protein